MERKYKEKIYIYKKNIHTEKHIYKKILAKKLTYRKTYI